MESREWSGFKVGIDGRIWKVDVSREAARDFLGIPNVDAKIFGEWIDLNTGILSGIAEQKVACGDHGPGRVAISAEDVRFEMRFLEALNRKQGKALIIG